MTMTRGGGSRPPPKKDDIIYEQPLTFTMFFRDSEVCLERYDSFGDFGYLTKNQTFLFEEKFVKEHVVLLL
jgi:hypothetical protein